MYELHGVWRFAVIHGMLKNPFKELGNQDNGGLKKFLKIATKPSLRLGFEGSIISIVARCPKVRSFKPLDKVNM